MQFRFEPVAAGCGLVLLLSIYVMAILPTAQRLLLVATVAYAHEHLKRDRWIVIRTHQWSYIRKVNQSLCIYHFAWKVDRAYNGLPLPKDALELYPNGETILDDILKDGPQTFQAKPTNRIQIESLMNCVCAQLVPEIQNEGAEPLVLDIGAGKALFTRAVYEALGRKVPVVALDSRRQHAKDLFYDPVAPVTAGGDNDDAPYTRVVADVRYLAAKTMRPLSAGASKGSVISITKHLCGGATDASIMAICAPPLNEYIGACCFAPCCHQKTKRNQYCNMAYLQSLGFCQTHTGLNKGEIQDPDFKTFGMLICMSRVTDLLDFEYSKSTLLHLLGFQRARDLGRKARRLLEEGRMRYLRDHGSFVDVHLVRYCEESITGDNLAIIARRRPVPTSV